MAERRSGGTPPSSTSTSRSGGVRRAMWIAGLGLTGLLAGCSAGGGEESGGIHGGEASLVLPDFTSVSFFGMQGNHLLMIGLLLCSQGFAATAQQNKMTTCNADASAKTLKGDERKAFMSTCLKAKPATQQDKMKTCNATAGTQALKGDARKAFMSDCLKKK